MANGIDSIVLERQEIENLLTENLYDKSWCNLNGIDYVNPNSKLAREITTKQYIQSKNYKD